MAQVKVNGTTLYYESAGDGPSMLFIHGMCGDARSWHDQIDRLSDRFHCIAYDRRGHSRSPLGEITQRTVELHADDATALVGTLGIAPCILIGSSGGARIGLDVVRRFPELVAGAVLSEPPLFRLDPPGAAEIVEQIKPAIEREMAAGNPRGAVDRFFEVVCPKLWRELPDERRDDYRANHVELLGDLLMPEYEVTPGDLARIDRPCLLIRGATSAPVFGRIARILADAIPGARMLEIAGSSHVTYFEQPAAFASAVASFTESLALPPHGVRDANAVRA